ncbi:MAG: AraC family transcriptional regulator [Alphaproteobacteria bacterium]|nr:AraC family transcriptional regulator [Alphaproteobacteria bacterium]
MDLLSDILANLKMVGTLYFRTEFSSPWGVAVPAYSNVSRFHFVHRGRCFAQVAGVAEPVLLEQGDLIIITHGAEHILSDPHKINALTVDQVIEQSGFTGKGALVYGGHQGGHETQLVCGHFAFDEDASHPLIDALPPFVHINDSSEATGTWLDSTLRIIGSEAGRGGLGGDLIALKLSETIFAQVIRTYLCTEGRDIRPFAAFADQSISRALEAMHADPARNWSLEAMASIAGMSRTVFAGRFSELMAMTPLAYLTEWRMQIARRLLLETDAPMIDVAEQSGYSSEASFGRVFKKRFSVPPAGYRKSRSEAA